MDVALGGRRRWSILQRLGPAAYLVAVTHSTCAPDPARLDAFVLDALRDEVSRREIGARICSGSLRRPKALTAALAGALGAVNDRVRASYGAGEDAVAAASSVTAVLVVRALAVVAHTGTTSVHIYRDGELTTLADDQPFEEAGGVPVLARAIGLQPHLELTTRTAELRGGDRLVFCNHRLRRGADRLRAAGGAEDGTLVIPYDDIADDAAPAAPGSVGPHARRVVAALLAMLLIFAALCVR